MILVPRLVTCVYISHMIYGGNNKEEVVSYPVHWKSDSAGFPQSLTWELSPSQVFCLPFKGFCGGLY